MFENLKDLFNLNKQISEKQKQLINLEKIISDKDHLRRDIEAPAIAYADKIAKEAQNNANNTVYASQQEANKIISASQTEASNIIANSQAQATQILINADEQLRQIRLNIQTQQSDLVDLNKYVSDAVSQKTDLENQLAEVTKKLESQSRKFLKIKEVYKSISYSIERMADLDQVGQIENYPLEEYNEDMAPSVLLKSHSMNIKDLRRRFLDNDKQINQLLTKYQERYTTKTNKAIYKLMVIALRAELQNIIYNLKFDKLDKNINTLRSMTAKYSAIASDGNQNIAPTIQKFIGQVEYFFIEAIKIEYEYYIQEEKIKEEQRMIRQQMREEATERKLLEQQQKQIEKEEEKYKAEIENIKAQLEAADAEKSSVLQSRIEDLQTMLTTLDEKREDILKRQNGQAGYVYVISNLGSFGEQVFKIGMTRRLNPQERVDELGDASVPFGFDVHSLIFSENAVDLETNIHKTLSIRRVNKVNLRKEFFRITIAELQELINTLEPSAEFKDTMLAAQYRQTIAIEENLLDPEAAFDAISSNGNDDESDDFDSEEAS